MKTRLQFESVDQARDHATQHGGRIAVKESGEVFWYSFEHTPTEIAADLNGEAVFGCVGAFE